MKKMICLLLVVFLFASEVLPTYAWYSRSTANNYNLDRTSSSAYLNDKSYLVYNVSPKAGVIADYGGAAGHAAVFINKDEGGILYVRSKWQFYGLYEHLPGYCPYGMITVPTYTYYVKNY